MTSAGSRNVFPGVPWHDSRNVERRGAGPAYLPASWGLITVTNVFAVVGEHRQEPERLLLLGDDGHYYAYATANGQPTEVDPSDEWQIDEGAISFDS